MTQAVTKHNWLVLDADELAPTVRVRVPRRGDGAPGARPRGRAARHPAGRGSSESHGVRGLRTSPTARGAPTPCRSAAPRSRSRTRAARSSTWAAASSRRAPRPRCGASRTRRGFPSRRRSWARARSRRRTRSPSGCSGCTGRRTRTGRCTRATSSSPSAPASTTASRGKLATFAPHAKVVHLDVDPVEIGKIRKADFPLRGDAKTVLRQLLPLVGAPRHERLARPDRRAGRRRRRSRTSRRAT